MSSTPSAAAAAPAGPISQYRGMRDGFDELRRGDGSVRDSWTRIAASIDRMGAAGLAQRSEQARLLLRESGVTYNVSGAPEGPDRPWELDPVPLLLSQNEWNGVATAVAQRVAVLNAILADVYGPQQLMRRKLLPAELVFGHPGYLVPCHGLSVPQGVHLHLYGGHLARQADGTWVVLADRTQGPSGAGYAVENRVIMSRIFPAEFKSLYVQRLASFFIALRDTLQSISPRDSDNPRIVLLSPGPKSPTYFEDAYLARYLGYTLAEGGDLTVRGTQVYLKTLGGLLPVDVILRRIPDEDIDPLELKPDSLLGVPGLVQAVREGQVAVANALGSGFLEAPALMPFLPEICRALRGEELLLQSVETWWCGRPDHAQYVESHLNELVVRPALLHRTEAPILGWQLSRAGREELLARIRKSPASFVGQRPVRRSTAPVWTGSSLEPWRMGLRTFAVASGGGYRVMPGGLSRMSAADSFMSESMSAGAVSKDLWILGSSPVEAVTLLKPSRAAVQLRRSGNDLPSRAADNLYWLGRLVERAESMVRHLRSIIVRLAGDVSPVGPQEIIPLYESLAKKGIWHDDSGQSPDALVEQISVDAVDFLFNPQRPAGLIATLESLRRTGAAIRDRLSIDSWRIINQLDPGTLLRNAPQGSRPSDVLPLLNSMINALSALSGLATESMTRGQGWRFLDMGRRIERAHQTLKLVNGTLVETNGELIPRLEAVLEVADSTMTYRYRYLTSLQLAPVLDLVLIDETNPRAVGFQFAALADHVKQLPGDPIEIEQREEPRLVLAAQAALRLSDVDAFCEPDAEGSRQLLRAFVEDLDDKLRRISEAVTQRYLVHTGVSHRLGLVQPHEGGTP